MRTREEVVSPDLIPVLLKAMVMRRFENVFDINYRPEGITQFTLMVGANKIACASKLEITSESKFEYLNKISDEVFDKFIAEIDRRLILTQQPK